MAAAVAFFIFNRPDTTARVFAEIARAKPDKLFVIADGPRSNQPGGTEQCLAAREIIKRVDWDCEVLTNYSDSNLGSGRRIASGLDWVFENVEEAIILEDDCLPHPSFFRFCEELLDKYRTDERIMMISGDNFQFGRTRSEYSYYFARYVHAWGWASWRRAWQHFDFDMKRWPQLRHTNWLENLLGDAKAANYWQRTFDMMMQNGRQDIWDYQWVFACWEQNGLSIVPQTNLISNIGFSDTATHTRDTRSKLVNLPRGEMRFPLKHPLEVSRNVKADQFDFEQTFAGEGGSTDFFKKIRRRLS